MTKENNQLITIGIPLYNMENSICNAIDSCLNQTYKNFEILIVDDKSTDNGVKVIEEKYKKEIKEGKIRIYKREQNGGVSYAMYDMVEQAKGEYIAILDADDTNYPTRIEKQYYAIKEAEKTHQNQMVACFCGSYVNNLTTHSHFTIDPNDLFLNFGGGTGHSMYKVADLLAMGNFDRSTNRDSDNAMCVKMLKNNCHYVMLSEPLIIYNFREALYKKILRHKDRHIIPIITKKIHNLIAFRQKFQSTGNVYLDRYYKKFTPISKIKILYIPMITKYSNSGTNNNLRYAYYLFGYIPLLCIRYKTWFYRNYRVIQYRLFGFIPVYTKIYYGIEQ